MLIIYISLPIRGQPGYDRVGKVRPVIDFFNKQFLALYNSGSDRSIDEAMEPYKGRSSLKQYTPKKPIKQGFKVWVRAEADIGYVSEFEVYTGRKDDGPEKNLGTKVVKNLTSNIYSKHHHIYFDNYFSSVDLMLHLLRNRTYSTGTLRSNRKGFPQDFI